MTCQVGFCGNEHVATRKWQPDNDKEQPWIYVDVCADHDQMYDAMREAGELVE